MRALVFGVGLLVGSGSAVAAVFALSCADSPGSGGSGEIAGDSGLDAPLGSGQDGAPSSGADAEPPPGDVCGDRRGLQSGSPWPLSGGCPTRAGWSSLTGPQTAATWWTVPLPTGASAPGILGSGTAIWLGLADGNVVAVKGTAVSAAHATGAAVRSSPAVRADGTAVVVGGDGVLYGLQLHDNQVIDDAGSLYPSAKVVFALAVGASASSPAIAADGTIYVGTLDGKLSAVKADGSAVVWSSDTHDTNGSSPALGQDGTVYVGSADHKLYAFDASGKAKWATDLGAEIHASPAVGGDGSVYIGSMDGQLHSVDPTGKLRWSYTTGGAITETPAVYAGDVYVGSADKKLHDVSTLDGTRRWSYATLGAVATPLIGPDGVVYVGSADEHVYAVTAKGDLYFSVAVKGRVTGAPAIFQGPVLVVVTDKGLVGLGP